MVKTKKFSKALDKITVTDNFVSSNEDIKKLKKELAELLGLWSNKNEEVIKRFKKFNTNKDLNFFKLTKIKRDLQNILNQTVDLSTELGDL